MTLQARRRLWVHNLPLPLPVKCITSGKNFEREKKPVTGMSSTKSYCIMAAATIILLAGCGRKGGPGDEYRPQPRLYHTVWVDPQIAYVDSLVTLIRADRIDSLKIEPGEQPLSQPASVEIAILEPRCNIAVGLLDENLGMIRPLMVRNLTPGFYRLTFNYDRLNAPELLPGNYFIRAEFCDSSRVTRFSVD
jgi:putative lipoprotein